MYWIFNSSHIGIYVSMYVVQEQYYRTNDTEIHGHDHQTATIGRIK